MKSLLKHSKKLVLALAAGLATSPLFAQHAPSGLLARRARQFSARKIPATAMNKGVPQAALGNSGPKAAPQIPQRVPPARIIRPSAPLSRISANQIERLRKGAAARAAQPTLNTGLLTKRAPQAAARQLPATFNPRALQPAFGNLGRNPAPQKLPQRVPPARIVSPNTPLGGLTPEQIGRLRRGPTAAASVPALNPRRPGTYDRKYYPGAYSSGGSSSGMAAHTSASTNAKLDLSRWAAMGSNLRSKTTTSRPGQIPAAALPTNPINNLPVAAPINPSKGLGLQVPNIAARKGLGGSPLQGMTPASNVFEAIKSGQSDTRDGLGPIEEEAPGGALRPNRKFDPESMIPMLGAGQQRGQELFDGLKAAGLAGPQTEALLGSSQESPPKFGHSPYTEGASADDLLQIPGLPGGQDLESFDKGGDPRVSNDEGTSTSTNSQQPPDAPAAEEDYPADDPELQLQPGETARIKSNNGHTLLIQYDNGTTFTRTLWDSEETKVTMPGADGIMSRHAAAEPLKQNEIVWKWRDGTSYTARWNDKWTRHIVTDKDGNSRGWITINKDRPVDESLMDATVTEETLRRWKAKQDALVDPTGPEGQVEHDAAKLSQRTVIMIQSKINPNPDAPAPAGEGSGSGKPPAVGPGVVDPDGPDTGNPKQGPKGPKPSVGPGKLIGSGGQAQAADSSPQSMLNQSQQTGLDPTSADPENQTVEQR